MMCPFNSCSAEPAQGLLVSQCRNGLHGAQAQPGEQENRQQLSEIS